MKVMLVKPIKTKHPDVVGCVHPEVGDKDIATGIWTDHNNESFYTLQRFPDDHGFNVTNFATLPERDADEMREEVREGIVNIETAII